MSIDEKNGRIIMYNIVRDFFADCETPNEIRHKLLSMPDGTEKSILIVAIAFCHHALETAIEVITNRE